jgi:hypothetical protein
MRLINVLKQRFGRLVVQQRIDGKWRCLCDCGNFNDMAAKALWYVKDGSSLKTFCKTWENVPLEKSFQG